ncbi:MAG: hypothetical protein LBG46_06445 [Elusimicrobiota bacterium]|jgi:hypothetical protein|nr:hypothetical protein [Elusimicrobiota bacterium]
MKNFLKDIKYGLSNVKDMLLEKRYKPFLFPLIIVVAVFFICRYINGVALEQVYSIKNKIDAQTAEINNEREYKAAKEIYEKLVKRLPPDEKKNEWLLSETQGLFSKNEIVPVRVGKQTLEESDGIFTPASVNFDIEVDYATLGKFIASVESSDKFIRISELAASRSEGNLGRIKVSFRINTVFIKGNNK